MSKPFEVIVADPPWSFKDTLTMSDVARGAASNYHVMSNTDIAQLPIQDFISPDGTILALWVPSSLLQEGLDTLNAWGFTHKQTYVWVKIRKIDSIKKEVFKSAKDLAEDLINKVPKAKALANFTLNIGSSLGFGMGRLFRQTHEICLIGISSRGIYKQLNNKSQRSVSFGENLRHSAKPEHLQDSLELMFPKARKLELFARRHRPGWTCLGDEICNGEDIRVSLGKL